MNAVPAHLLPPPEPTGYIQPGALRELWFHTGTACNLACPFCLEGSMPGDGRLQRITLADVRPLMDEAVALGVLQFSFTGGEPFIVKDFVNILHHASTLKPCLVLTNGTDPVLKRLQQIETLTAQPCPVAFRISIDYADEARHDASRGCGSYAKSWRSLHEFAHTRVQGLGGPAARRRRECRRSRGNLSEAFQTEWPARRYAHRGLPGIPHAGRQTPGYRHYRTLHDRVSHRRVTPQLHVPFFRKWW